MDLKNWVWQSWFLTKPRTSSWMTPIQLLLLLVFLLPFNVLLCTLVHQIIQIPAVATYGNQLLEEEFKYSIFCTVTLGNLEISTFTTYRTMHLRRKIKTDRFCNRLLIILRMRLSQRMCHFYVSFLTNFSWIIICNPSRQPTDCILCCALLCLKLNYWIELKKNFLECRRMNRKQTNKQIRRNNLRHCLVSCRVVA